MGLALPNTLNFGMITIAISLYKTPLGDQTLQKFELPPPDLRFWIMKSAAENFETYDAEKHCLYANFQDVLIVSRLDGRLKNRPASLSIRPWDKRAVGAINGIPDLLNAQFVATVSMPGTIGLSREMEHQLQINSLDIAVSDELYLTFDADGNYTSHIFGWSHAHQMRQMRQLKAESGQTLYVYQFPGTIKELVGSPSIP
jgi:hypothetical protein